MTEQRAEPVSREPEAAAVAALLKAAASEPAGLVITGEAGIGKTTQWLSGHQEARALGFRVLSARGDPSEVRLSFAALADLLDDVEPGVIEQLPPVQRGALNRVLLRGNDGPAMDEQAAAVAFRSVAEHLSSESPVLIAIDDLQWLDTASKAVVRFATRRLSGPVGVFITVRTSDSDVTDSGSWLQLHHPDAVTRVRMAPLSVGGLHQLVSNRLGRVLPRPKMMRIFELSGGNPMYALELARAVADGRGIDRQLPDTLAALVRARVQGVDAETAGLLLAAACTPEATVESVAAVTHTSIPRVVELLESGDAARIVSITGDRIRFSHPLLASGVYTGAGPARRRDMHRRLAEYVDVPELRARHLASAAVSGDDATLNALDAAAAVTRDKGAPAAAAELLELAIGLGGDTPVRRILAAKHHFEAGSITTARRHLEGTADLLPPGVLRGVAVMLQGAVDGYDGSFTAAVEALTEGVGQVSDHPKLRLQGLMLLAPAVGITGRMSESVELARQAMRSADDIGDPGLRSQARAVYLNISVLFGMDVDRAVLQEALSWQGDADPISSNMRADAIAALIDAWVGELDRAEPGMRRVKQQVAERGSEIDALWVDNHLTMIQLWAGRYDQAALTADEQDRRADQLGGHHARLIATTCRAAVAAYTGQIAQARSAATIAIQLAHDTGGLYLAAYPTTSLGLLEVSLGDYGAALEVLEPLLKSFEPQHGMEIATGGWLPDAVEALAGLGRIDEAESLVKVLHDNGTRMNRRWMLAASARGRALCLAARGDLAEAEQAAADAMEHHALLPMPFERARTQLLLGQLQRRRRRRQDATATLSAALKTFETIGAPLWADRARGDLARLNRTERRSRSNLSPAEQRVAQRAADGLSNKEIAAEQFLAIKTVETTLSSVYRKLGIRSRAQLHARLDGDDFRENPDSRSARTQ
ncbi:helix-turn-helix transcriptional regulator [Mycolicibacterium hodleri]|uniref:LuxR family transcriptional regulator n=1 Tax=Mycolicibacterium hodleri TaxID=49897 RepID=A0A502EFS8_9MYCO|nr:LuxR family transcriptional regulator [Mycolicibacterium hodleri]TPG35842.1 LuxR family transcriptional regulator [Mycolicibacterium hodleri]